LIAPIPDQEILLPVGDCRDSLRIDLGLGIELVSIRKLTHTRFIASETGKVIAKLLDLIELD
jgi:hypothetical protein